MKKYDSIDGYIKAQSKTVQPLLNQLRQTIKKSAPKAMEVISYRLPAFKLQGVLVYFGVFKNHIGFFPTASGVTAFKQDLSAYKCSKGAIRFPFNKPLPLTLISKIVKFRVKEDSLKGK